MEWVKTNTYEELPLSEHKQWEAFLATESEDWDEYDNGYRVDIWHWNNQTMKNIIAFPGDTPVGALFLNDDPEPIITESDGDLNNADIENITELQQELQNNIKVWKHIQRTFETLCHKGHPHCLEQYYKKLKSQN